MTSTKLLIGQIIVVFAIASVWAATRWCAALLGYAGLSDRIDHHTWQLLKGVAVSTVLGVGTEISWGSSDSDLVRAIREAAQQNGAPAGDQLVSRSLDVQPTLCVRPGWPLMVMVHKDIVLRPWRGSDL